MAAALAERGILAFSDRRVHAPLGLDLGDPTPGGIALSIGIVLATSWPAFAKRFGRKT